MVCCYDNGSPSFEQVWRVSYDMKQLAAAMDTHEGWRAVPSPLLCIPSLVGLVKLTETPKAGATSAAPGGESARLV